MHSDDVMRAQRALRTRLLDDRNTLPWRPARDFAAQLLLYVDDPQQCWRICVEWLRESFDADRVDGGFAAPGRQAYTPQVEALRPDRAVPSVVGAAMDTRDRGIAMVWSADRAVGFADVEDEARFSLALRGQLLSIGTRAKLAVSLRDGDEPVGLLCADWLGLRHTWDAQACERLTLLTKVVLGPVLAAARRVASDGWEGPMRGHLASLESLLADLTPAELKVARIAATGISYKEIARQLDRSFSTVDHQLRSVRDKLGVSSTARLVRVLSEHLDARVN